jgi:hypothetical protein
MRAIYATAFVIAPEMGHVAEIVLNSPTAADKTCHSAHKAEKV